jgi:hypothetical protein
MNNEQAVELFSESGISILSYVLEFLDARDIHFDMRDTICSAVVATFTFFLYNNTLRL